MTVTAIRHPYYTTKIIDWEKWRRTYDGGQQFIDHYLETFSKREGEEAFNKRKKISYNPAFAKEAVNEIKNSVFQRLSDIKRIGGSNSYTTAISGKSGGVDLLGSSMNFFIGKHVLPELLVMSKVGIYVDMPVISGVTIAENLNKRPYLYTYRVEDICSWAYDDDANQNEFNNILLREYYFEYDKETGLIKGEKSRYRHLWLDGNVKCQFYTDGGDKQDGIIELNIDRIPFIVVEISDSLLAEVANYQIALLNLASSDMAYSLNSNFPFYTEQYDPRATMDDFMKKPEGKVEEIKVGTTTGRKYVIGAERPGFINPSSEPLAISMEKQEQLKKEIRQLVNLAVTNLSPKMASAESKRQDQSGLEDGLSYIGTELEYMENKIASFWAMYENSKPATINYPSNYTIKSEQERLEEAKNLGEIASKVPSGNYQKVVAKRIAELTVGRMVSQDELKAIKQQIDEAPGTTSDPEIIAKDVEVGLCDLETASKLRNYPKGCVDKAAKDHADRLARIAISQTKGIGDPSARGIDDLSDNPNSGGSDEKKQSRDTTEDDKVTDKTRGEGH